ncbi:MAG: phosphoribosylamine--glycine ligase [Rhodospirillaceae bacterium]|nr:phosphoribosylamine--glycine ligase [Rhodospirillaceae bacterium]
MKVLVVGSGGREHALAWAIAKSPNCKKLYCSPGNGGIANVAECVDIAAENVDAIVEFAIDEKIDFVVIGPEGPLVLGLADKLAAEGIKSFGPSAGAAMIEGSKGLMKDLCAKYDIPTAEYARFDECDAAKEYIRAHGAPIVVKADGLAAGKGVIMCRNENEAYAAIDHMMIEDQFGDAGSEVVIEEMMQGEEASYFALVDGEHALALVGAQDHKAAFDGDEGPNTGGMGAYTPAPVLDDALAARVMKEIIEPTIKGMAAEGTPYQGVLYAGLMITESGPKLIEYNCRFGDPECQPLMMRLKSDALELLLATAEGRLDKVKPKWHKDAALTVVMAAEGYPASYSKGTEIKGVDEAGLVEGVTVFHAGTKRDGDKLLAVGGRVLNVTAMAPTVAEAHKRAYEAVDKIDWPEGFCRRDIGWRAVGR